MAKKQKREKGGTPFFSTKTITRIYKTKDSVRSYQQVYYFKDGKRTSLDSISKELNIDELVFEEEVLLTENKEKLLEEIKKYYGERML